MTTRQLLNKILTGLRQFSLLLEDAATETTDDYVLMLLQLLNEAKEECEECGWPWQSLRQTVTVTLASGTAEYTLTSAGDADVDTNDRSQLLFEQVTEYGASESFRNSDRSLPQVFNVTDSTEYRLKEITQERMERYHLTDSDETGQPVYFALWQSGSSLKMKFWPTPDAVYSIKLRVYIPQDELASDALGTELTMPDRPVWTKALYKANQERGEELSRPDSAAERAYVDALAVAVAREQTKVDQTVYFEN